MWLHFILILIVPFALLFWLNSSIYKKLTEQAVTLHRTGQKYLRKREMRLGKERQINIRLLDIEEMIYFHLLMKTISGRVSMSIVLVYLLCHSPKLVLTFFEIMFKDAMVCISSTQQLSRNLILSGCPSSF